MNCQPGDLAWVVRDSEVHFGAFVKAGTVVTVVSLIPEATVRGLPPQWLLEDPIPAGLIEIVGLADHLLRPFKKFTTDELIESNPKEIEHA